MTKRQADTQAGTVMAQDGMPSTAEPRRGNDACAVAWVGGRLFCELCGSFANAFCHSDEALLCQSCDSSVHRANFLASRHVRAVLCSACSADTAMKVTGPAPPVFPALCASCHCSYHGVDWMQPCEARVSRACMGARDVGQAKRSFQMNLPSECPFAGRELAHVRPSAFSVPQRISPMSVLSAEGGSVVNAGDWSNASTPLTPGMKAGMSPHRKRQKHEEEGEAEGGWNQTSRSIPDDASDLSEELDDCSHTPAIVTSQLIEQHKNKGDSSEQKEVLPPPKKANKKLDNLGEQASARLKRVLANWHRELGLSGGDTCHLAFHLFKCFLMKIQAGKMAAESLRVTLAACLWVATKIDEHQTAVRKAPEVSIVAGVESSQLLQTETQILNLLSWSPLEGWVRPGSES